MALIFVMFSKNCELKFIQTSEVKLHGEQPPNQISYNTYVIISTNWASWTLRIMKGKPDISAHRPLGPGPLGPCLRTTRTVWRTTRTVWIHHLDQVFPVACFGSLLCKILIKLGQASHTCQKYAIYSFVTTQALFGTFIYKWSKFMNPTS